MTAILGIETENGCWIGTDSIIIDGAYTDTQAGPKWSHCGKLLVAAAGSVGAIQRLTMGLCEADLDPPRYPDELNWWADMVLSPSIRKIAAVEYDEEDEDEDKSAPQLEFLVAVSGYLFICGGKGDVYRSSRGYAAVGAPVDTCRALLEALSHMEPRNRMEETFRIAEMHSACIRGPYHYAHQTA